MIFVIWEESADIGAERVKSFADSCRTFITPKDQNQPEIELNATDKSVIGNSPNRGAPTLP